MPTFGRFARTSNACHRAAGAVALRCVEDARMATAVADETSVDAEALDVEATDAPSQDYEPVTFETLFPSLPKESKLTLEEDGIREPSPIQERAAAPLLAGQHAILHAETGQGKTLAYLLPALVRLQQREDAFILVIAPSRELAVQTTEVAERHVRGKTALITNAIRPSPEAVSMAKVVIATPNHFLEWCDKEDAAEIKVFLQRVEVCVLDEFDELMPKKKFDGKQYYRYQDNGMWHAEAVVKRLLKTSDVPSLQLVAVSATAYLANREKLKKNVKKDQRFKDGKDFMVIEGAKRQDEQTRKQFRFAPAHSTLPPGIRHLCWKVYNFQADMGYIDAIQGALEKIRPHSALVFLTPNCDMSVQGAVEELNKRGWTGVIRLNKHMFPDSRYGKGGPQKWKRGLSGDRKAGNSMEMLEQMRGKMREGWVADYHDVPIIVMAEETKRGMDLGPVEAVFVVGMPKDACSYMHMAGRTARLPHPYGYSCLVASPRATGKVMGFQGQTTIERWTTISPARGRKRRVPPIPRLQGPYGQDKPRIDSRERRRRFDAEEAKEAKPALSRAAARLDAALWR